MLLLCMQVVIDIFAHVFMDDDGHWDCAAMHSAMNQKYQHISYMGPLADSNLYTCFLNCLDPKQP
jgi:hypothetical protein